MGCSTSSGQHAAAAGEASGTDQAISSTGDRSRPGGRPDARSIVDIPVARKRVLRRENNLLSPHRCRRRGGNPHDGEIITRPRTSCGAPMAFGCSRWTTAGAGTAVADACLQARRPADLHGACRCISTAAGAARAGLADGSRLPVSVDHFTNQIKFWGIQPSYAGRRPRRAVQSHAVEQIIGRIYRNIAELRDAVRDFVEL